MPLRSLATLLVLLLTIILTITIKSAMAIAPIVETCYGSFCARAVTGHTITMRILAGSLVKVKLLNTYNKTLYYTIYLNNRTIAYGAARPGTLITRCITILSEGKYELKIVIGNYTYNVILKSFKYPVKISKKIYYVPYRSETYLVVRFLQNVPVRSLYVNNTRCVCTNRTCTCIIKLFENLTIPHNASLDIQAVDYADIVRTFILKIVLVPIVKVAKIYLKRVSYEDGILTLCLSVVYCSPPGTIHLTILLDEINITKMSVPCGQTRCINIPVLILPGQHVIVLESSNYMLAGAVYKVLLVKRQFISCTIYGPRTVTVFKRSNFLVMFRQNVNGLLRILVYDSHGTAIFEKNVSIKNDNVVKFSLSFNRSGKFKIISLFEGRTSVGRCMLNISVVPLKCSIEMLNKSLIETYPLKIIKLAGYVDVVKRIGRFSTNMLLLKLDVFVDKKLVKSISIHPRTMFHVDLLFNSSGLHNVTLVTYCKGIVSPCHASFTVNVSQYKTYVTILPSKNLCVVGSPVYIYIRLNSSLNRDYAGLLKVVMYECGHVAVRYIQVNESILSFRLVPKCPGMLKVEVQYLGDGVHGKSNIVRIVIMVVPGVFGVPLTHIVATAVTVILGYYVSNLAIRRKKA